MEFNLAAYDFHISAKLLYWFSVCIVLLPKLYLKNDSFPFITCYSSTMHFPIKDTLLQLKEDVKEFLISESASLLLHEFSYLFVFINH